MPLGSILSTRAPVQHTVARSKPLSGVRILVTMPSIPVQGMERANLQIMRMMRAQGAEVLFVTERTWGERVRREVERIGCQWTRASFAYRMHLPRSPRQATELLLHWARSAWEIGCAYRAFRPTHIHVTNLSYLLCSLPTLLRAKAVVTFRLPNPPDQSLTGWPCRLSNFIWRRVVASVCDIIVCNSRYTLTRLQATGVKAKMIRLIYNCVPERARSIPSDAPALYRDRFNVVFVGKISRSKGVHELFDVAARIVTERDDVDFCFVGEHHWNNPFADALIREVEAKRWGSRIRFTGVKEDVFGVLEQCHLHVSPSVSPNESFPNVVLEAKAVGLPSVVFPTAGLTEAVTHLVDGYVCRESSVQALYEGIRYFLDNRSALRAAGQAARRSLNRFSREGAARQWVEVFRDGSGSP